MPGLLPKAVLFACDLNRVRSPMAAALLQRLCGEKMRVESCGLEPAEDIDPFVLSVMGEWGLDLAAHRPKSFEVLSQEPFDLLISLTPQAQARAAGFARERPMEIEYWPTSDPKLESGARGNSCANSLPEPVGDAALGQVVGGHLYQHLIAGQDTDAVFPELAGGVGDDLVLVLQFNAEGRVRQEFDHRAWKLKQLFLRHITLWRRRRKAARTREPFHRSL